MTFRLLVVFGLLLASSCEELSQRNTVVLPESKGRAGEIVLISKPHVRQSVLNAQLDSLLRNYQPYLGQPEEYYRVMEMNPEDVTNYTRLNGLQLIIESDDSLDRMPGNFWSAIRDTVKVVYRDDSVSVKLLVDLWARPQHALYIRATNIEVLADFIGKRREFLLNYILGMEYELIGRRYAGARQDSISKRVAEVTGIKLSVPPHYRIAKLRDSSGQKGFAWIRNETSHISQSVLLYYRPYIDSLAFTTEALVMERDSVAKYNVPGAAPNSYMSTFTEWPLTVKEINFRGQYAKEIYGLWNTQNDFMGGPFYSLTFYDKKGKRLITAEGFVHAPKYNKTQYLRELIGIIGTMELQAN